jgi:hypothetical protein
MLKHLPLVRVLRLLLDWQVDQEEKDKANPQLEIGRMRSPWETGISIIFNEFTEACCESELREHLCRLRLDGYHAPTFTTYRQLELGGVESPTSLSRQLARLDERGFGRTLADRLQPKYPKEIAKLVRKLGVSTKRTDSSNRKTPNKLNVNHITPLTAKEMRVLEIIKGVGPGRGITGAQICEFLSMGTPPMELAQSTLTKHIIPALKKHGVKNKRGLGYYWQAT